MKCPYCAEEIENEAIVCRFCGQIISLPRENEQLREKIASLERQVSELAAAINNQPTESQSMLDEHTTVKPLASSPDGGVTLKQLQSIMPNLDEPLASEYLPYLNAAMAEADINTPLRQAAFLAQLAFESGELQWFEEVDDGARREGREDLGNVYDGDGSRYKGRGPIQLTGRHDYTRASEDLGLDLVNNPERAADSDVSFRTACWYWTSRDLNSYADVGDFNSLTFTLNGGYNGYEERFAYYMTAREVLNAQ